LANYPVKPFIIYFIHVAQFKLQSKLYHRSTNQLTDSGMYFPADKFTVMYIWAGSAIELIRQWLAHQ